jgi:hypothetical protein
VDGDYIELTGPNREPEIVTTLVRLLDPTDVLGGVRSFPLLALARDIEMFVDDCGDGLVRLAIAELGTDARRRRACARRVYETLAQRTGWSLRWTADDVEGGSHPGQLC